MRAATLFLRGSLIIENNPCFALFTLADVAAHLRHARSCCQPLPLGIIQHLMLPCPLLPVCCEPPPSAQQHNTLWHLSVAPGWAQGGT